MSPSGDHESKPLEAPAPAAVVGGRPCAAGHAWQPSTRWRDNLGRIYESVICARCGEQRRELVFDPGRDEGRQ
jgi:hypothetical protein